MTPAQRAANVYQREPCSRTFREDLEAHLLNGYVFSTPETFLMGRAVQHDADPALIVNPWHGFETGDCWHVYLAAGEILRDVTKLMPFPLLIWLGRGGIGCGFGGRIGCCGICLDTKGDEMKEFAYE